MKQIIFFLLLCLCSQKIMAQVAEVDSLQLELQEQNIVIFKDARLDALEKRPSLLAKLEQEIQTEKKEKEIPLYKPIVSADGKKKVTGSIYTVKGFRIIIYNGADKNAALSAKNNFSRMFPGTRSYLSYNVPSYKIKIGDFDEKNDATRFLKRVITAFPSAFIVPDVVTVKNINVTQ